MARRAQKVVGVDVFRGRWVAVGLADGMFDRADRDASLAALLQRFADAEVVGVDMPIGLPRRSRRVCDLAAREFAGRRRASVFEAPPLPAMEAETHAEATAIAVEIIGRGISAQAFALKDRIREVKAVRRSDKRLIEVHPEVSFCAMNDAVPLEFSKRTWGGQAERRALLASHRIKLPKSLGEADVVPVDDILDAAAAAWTAARYAQSRAESLPEGRKPGTALTIWR